MNCCMMSYTAQREPGTIDTRTLFLKFPLGAFFILITAIIAMRCDCGFACLEHIPKDEVSVEGTLECPSPQGLRNSGSGCSLTCRESDLSRHWYLQKHSEPFCNNLKMSEAGLISYLPPSDITTFQKDSRASHL